MPIDEWLRDVFRGEGIVFAASATFLLIAIALVLRALIDRSERARVRPPVLFAFGYLLTTIFAEIIPGRDPSHRFLSLLALLFLLLSVGRLLTLFIVDWLVRRPLRKQTPRILRDIMEGVLVVIALLATLRTSGIDAGSLLTTSALLTAVIGLSLQDTLGNLFAGLSLQAQPPFSVGDFIQVDRDGLQAGTVVELNWRATTVLTLDDAELTIPNAQLARAIIVNHSRPKLRVRRTVIVTAPYEIPTQRVHDVLLKALAMVPGVIAGPDASVVTHAFVDLGVQYAVRFYIEQPTARERLESNVRDRIWIALQRAGIPIMTPHPRPELGQERDDEPRGTEHDALAQRARAIAHVDFLRELPEKALLALARNARHEHYHPGEIVVRQGERSDELYFCLSGELVVVHSLADGKTRELARLAQGSVFGELAQMTGEPRNATVQTLSSCELVVISKAALTQVLGEDPDLAALISTRMAERKAALDASNLLVSPEAQRASVEQHKARFLQRLRSFLSM